MASKLREFDRQHQLNTFQTSIGYAFKNPDVLQQALTHKSASSLHYERLEFLGDSILNNSITIYLYEHFPQLDEGVLSRVRASLVKGETLAELAKEHHLGKCLQLGTGELRSGGYKRASILADAMEAVIAAVFLESGFDQACQLVWRLFATRLSEEAIASLGKDEKSHLQEYLQARQLPLPVYTVEETHGKDHQQQFTVSCYIESFNLKVHAKASSKKNAEKAVARQALEQISKMSESNV